MIPQIHAALCDRWNEAADRAPGRATTSWHSLMDASVWLIDQGIADEPPCRGEAYFNMSLSRVRTYLDGLSHSERRAMIEAGRRVIFEGGRCRPAIFPFVTMEMAA